MPDIEEAKTAAYQLIAGELREAVPLSLLQPQQVASDHIVEKLADAGLVTDMSTAAGIVLGILGRECPENTMAADIIATRIMNILHKEGVLIVRTDEWVPLNIAGTSSRIPEYPHVRRRRESDLERQDENEYLGLVTPEGPHPLSLVPPPVLEAARAQLHEILVQDGDVAFDMASPVADTLVGAVLPLLRPDLVPGEDGDWLAGPMAAGLTPEEAAVWEALRLAASGALRLIDSDCQHTMEKAEVCTMFHGLQRWLAARPFQRQLHGLDGEPDDPRSS